MASVMISQMSLNATMMVEIAVWELKDFSVSNVFVKILTQAIQFWQLSPLTGKVILQYKGLTINYFEILFVFQMKYVMLKIQKLGMECVIQKLLFSTVVTMMLEIVQVQDLNLKHFNFDQIGFIKRAV